MCLKDSRPIEQQVMPLLIKDIILGKLVDRLNQFEKQINTPNGMLTQHKIRIRIRELKKIISLVQSA